MPGAPLSRWTMSYFAVSLICLLMGLAAMGAGFGFPADDAGAPDTLVIVHLLAIGWLGLLFCGALLQFVPVLAAAKPRFAGLAAPALILLICGLSALLTGFLSLGGWLDFDLAIMPTAAACLATGFIALALSFAATILSQPVMDHSGRLVLIGLAALLVTIALGAAFTGVLSGMIDLDWGADLLARGLPVHALSGTAGWMSITAVGVSYRLFSMFMLAPETGFSTRRLVSSVVPALLVLWVGLLLAFVHPSVVGLAAPVAILLFGIALIVYLVDITRMVRARRRKILELNTVAGLAALAYLVVAFAMFALDQIAPDRLSLGPAAIYALAMGWLSGLGLAQLYKIVPFLTWLEAYGPVMGRAPVPRVQDLVKESRGRLWFVLYHLGVSMGVVALLLSADMLFRLAAFTELAAVAGLAVEFLRARRLRYAPAGLPQGAVRPHLLYANPI
ncbi:MULTISPECIES: hypothetical protein [unclassified Rhizobium]|uniref:hypothetical protein n=1 Tax=unclassified Rhizobium TaxID=2613769 RepID=UPI000700EC74|nr:MULTISPECIES: hypothetical protein [unclassified Rhizobium]KQV39954.1 hypothetical protein ASC86_22170 [Rhizobium sp. Root1212]KRD31664.1 hypothetical protein ASE37_23215 [Rhizobium sp. Root268]